MGLIYTVRNLWCINGKTRQTHNIQIVLRMSNFDGNSENDIANTKFSKWIKKRLGETDSICLYPHCPSQSQMCTVLPNNCCVIFFNRYFSRFIVVHHVKTNLFPITCFTGEFIDKGSIANISVYIETNWRLWGQSAAYLSIIDRQSGCLLSIVVSWAKLKINAQFGYVK